MRVRVAHISLQFSDSNKQHTADLEKLFDRAVDRRYGWITGTEAGPGASNTAEELLRVGNEHGFRLWVPSEQAKGEGRATDCWIAVRRDLVSGNWERNYVPVIPGSSALYRDRGLSPDLDPRWGPKGVVSVGFDCDALQARVNVAAAHHLTGGRNPKASVHGVNHYEWNEKLDDALTQWMRETGKGRGLAFMGLDRNASDSGDESIDASTTLADELKAWQNTGHGPIDWISSYNRDGRVTAERFVVLDDKEFHLHTDHFLLEGVFGVAPIKR